MSNVNDHKYIPNPESTESGTIYEFLLGAKPFDGVWFGDKHPTRGGLFWWRTILSEQLQQASEGWISVNDGFPEVTFPRTEYLVYTNEGIDIAGFESAVAGIWPNVIFYRHLPAPPTVEKGGGDE